MSMSDHCDSEHRVIVGRADLFWASHVIIFLGQPDAPLSLHGATIMSNFFWFWKPINYVRFSN
jgi:hypothetical protein